MKILVIRMSNSIILHASQSRHNILIFRWFNGKLLSYMDRSFSLLHSQLSEVRLEPLFCFVWWSCPWSCLWYQELAQALDFTPELLKGLSFPCESGLTNQALMTLMKNRWLPSLLGQESTYLFSFHEISDGMAFLQEEFLEYWKLCNNFGTRQN